MLFAAISVHKSIFHNFSWIHLFISLKGKAKRQSGLVRDVGHRRMSNYKIKNITSETGLILTIYKRPKVFKVSLHWYKPWRHLILHFESSSASIKCIYCPIIKICVSPVMKDTEECPTTRSKTSRPRLVYWLLIFTNHLAFSIFHCI